MLQPDWSRACRCKWVSNFVTNAILLKKQEITETGRWVEIAMWVKKPIFRSRAHRIAEHGEGLNVMRQIKRALDPHNLMNPGKMVRV